MTKRCSTKAADAKVTVAAAAIVDIWMGGDQAWRARLGDSDFLESGDWQRACEEAQAVLAALEVADTRQDTEQGSGAITRNPAPCAAPPMGPSPGYREVTIDRNAATKAMRDTPTEAMAKKIEAAPYPYVGDYDYDSDDMEKGWKRGIAQAAHIVRTAMQAARSETPEATPFTYAYRYSSWPPEGATVIRFGTGGREINGSKPIEAIPLYTRSETPVQDDDAELGKLLEGGTLSVTSFDGPAVRIDFETREEAEQLSDLLANCLGRRP